MLILTFEVTTSENFSWIFTKDEANGETLSKMNGNVDISSAYNGDEIGIHIENHRGSGRSRDFMDVDLLEEEPCINVIDVMRACWFVVNLNAQFLYMKTA